VVFAIFTRHTSIIKFCLGCTDTLAKALATSPMSFAHVPVLYISSHTPSQVLWAEQALMKCESRTCSKISRPGIYKYSVTRPGLPNFCRTGTDLFEVMYLVNTENLVSCLLNLALRRQNHWPPELCLCGQQSPTISPTAQEYIPH
jgi:hypothetical protein